MRALPNASYFLILDLDQDCRIEFCENSSKALEFADGIWLAHYIRDVMHAKTYQTIVFTRNGQRLEYEQMMNLLFVNGPVTDPKNWPFTHALLTTFLMESQPLSLYEQAPLF